LACFGSGLATALAASLPLATGLATTLDLGTAFFPALATGLRTGFFGAALRLADWDDFRAAGLVFVAFREAGFAGRFDLGLAAFLAAGFERGLDLGATLDFAGDLRAGFAGFLAMVILDGNGCWRGARGSRVRRPASRQSRYMGPDRENLK